MVEKTSALPSEHHIASSNAIMRVTERINYYDINGEIIDEILCINIEFTDKQETKQVIIPFCDISSKKAFASLENLGVIFSNTDKKQFVNSVLQQRRLLTEHSVLVLPQGYSQYRDVRYWALGNEKFIYGNHNNIELATYENSPKLRKSLNGSYRKSFEFLDIDDSVSPMLFLAIGFSVWEKLLEQAGYPQRTVIYIVGETGIGKSSIAREITKIFNEKSELTLSSTYAALKWQIQRYCSTVIYIDDYNESEFKAVKREKGYKLSEIISAYADREELCKTENRAIVNLTIDGSLVITAEQPINNPSTMNRCIVVTPHEIDWDVLTDIQESNRKDAIFADLMKKLIYYTLQNYDFLIEQIPKWYAKICEYEKSFDKYRSASGYRRVLGSYRVFMLVIIMWEDFLDSNEINSSDIKAKMVHSLESSIEYTMTSLDTTSSEREILMASKKSIAYLADKNQLAYNKFDFQKEKYKALRIDDKKIYIQGDILQELVSYYMKTEISKKHISNVLYSHALINRNNGRYSKAIPKSNSHKRYYCINYSKLCKICNPDDDTLNIFK